MPFQGCHSIDVGGSCYLGREVNVLPAYYTGLTYSFDATSFHVIDPTSSSSINDLACHRDRTNVLDQSPLETWPSIFVYWNIADNRQKI